MTAPSLPGRVYTIGSGRLASFADFEAAAKSVRGDLRFADITLPPTGFAGFTHQRQQPFDVSLARRELGFAARRDLASSFADARRFVEP